MPSSCLCSFWSQPLPTEPWFLLLKFPPRNSIRPLWAHIVRGVSSHPRHLSSELADVCTYTIALFVLTPPMQSITPCLTAVSFSGGRNLALIVHGVFTHLLNPRLNITWFQNFLARLLWKTRLLRKAKCLCRSFCIKLYSVWSIWCFPDRGELSPPPHFIHHAVRFICAIVLHQGPPTSQLTLNIYFWGEYGNHCSQSQKYTKGYSEVPLFLAACLHSFHATPTHAHR